MNYLLFTLDSHHYTYAIMNSQNQYINSEESENQILSEPLHAWGGAWTEEKLNSFEKYVKAYLTIMNKYREQYGWKLIYFDGFAGSGSRAESLLEADSPLMKDLFDDDALSPQELSIYKGSAERVLSIPQRGFDCYFFIDKDQVSSNMLKERLSKFKTSHKLIFRNSDANHQVKIIAEAMKKDCRYASLVFLDPFGMQVNWDAIKELQNTRTDLWILIPTGVIVNRLLDRKGKLEHIDKLKTFFGKDEEFLRNYFYTTNTERTLFGDVEIIQKVGMPIQKIAELYINQLKTVFKHVTEKPKVLYNTRNTPIFHFAFASNNATAKKIANQIIQK